MSKQVFESLKGLRVRFLLNVRQSRTAPQRNHCYGAETDLYGYRYGFRGGCICEEGFQGLSNTFAVSWVRLGAIYDMAIPDFL